MISSRFLAPTLLAAGLTACAAPTSREPANISSAKFEVKAYIDSGAYQEDLAAVAAPASEWIRHRARTRPGKLAVIFDIDETALSNLPQMHETDWGYQPAVWDAWVAKSAAPAIDPVREVYQTARQENVAVFFLTGRKESDRTATVRNLRQQGMGDYEALLVRPPDSKESAVIFKTAERKRLTGLGYTIIANLGDQQSDLDGGYSERNYKLPNPFYLIP
ncbi:MAG: HAD family acid phosphatase [Akkermansiaceae bacterium]